MNAGGQGGNGGSSDSDLKKKKEEAKHHVAELTDEKIRQSIENMIENEDSYIIDTILKYVR